MEHDKLYGGETVAKQLYIHYDSVSNHVLTKSIAFRLSALPQSEIPQNLLLLNGKSSLATHDPYTGFMWVKGRKKCVSVSPRGWKKAKRRHRTGWTLIRLISFIN